MIYLLIEAPECSTPKITKTDSMEAAQAAMLIRVRKKVAENGYDPNDVALNVEAEDFFVYADCASVTGSYNCEWAIYETNEIPTIRFKLTSIQD